ncbi:MAG: aminodeoxychorismate synthase component I [Syntrophobacteraceae bacterium]
MASPKALRVHSDPPLLLQEDLDDEAFLQICSTAATSPFSVVLLSGGPPSAGQENRFSLAAWDPFATLRSKGVRCHWCTPVEDLVLDADALTILDEVWHRFIPEPGELPSPLPFAGGAVGYFAYDLKDSIETLPQTAIDDLDLPDLLLIWPRRILLHDRQTRSLYRVTVCYEGDPEPADPGGWPEKHCKISPSTLKTGLLRSNFTREAYLQAVARARHYIREGDIYQVNLSQRFTFPFAGDPFQLWWALFRMNPAPFYAFVNAGDHQVLSTSMERFLYRRGETIETRPIKGTRKRGATPDEDNALVAELCNDPKEDAELSMIVDLLRNDLGRICRPRTIRVAEHKRLESYQNVHHLVSIVRGELRSGTTYADILRSTFPGGSITGCPKIRAMEIIDELEPCVRHVYTGSIGYLGWHANMDLNIAIRTVLAYNGHCYFSVGGGIVYDSSEEAEYEETLHKGRTLFQLMERLNRSQA